MTSGELSGELFAKFEGVFGADQLAGLARRGSEKATVRLTFEESDLDLCFSIRENALTIDHPVFSTPMEWPVFLPTRELVSIYPGFVTLYERSEVPFEETWRDPSFSSEIWSHIVQTKFDGS
ncbi:MAG: hypothetical protein HYX27_27625 [Acidobacteria bacterium]|nr:hypothetical protein [Acidobacteriota bacterium]